MGMELRTKLLVRWSKTMTKSRSMPKTEEKKNSATNSNVKMHHTHGSCAVFGLWSIHILETKKIQ